MPGTIIKGTFSKILESHFFANKISFSVPSCTISPVIITISGLSAIIAIFTILIVLYLNFGLKLNPEFTNIAKNNLTFCLIYLTMAWMNNISDYLFGADIPIIIKAVIV